MPYGEGVSPQVIRDEEELQRLAGLQLRDNLVRGLGVSEQLQVALETSERPGSSAAPAQPQFFTHTVYHDSGVDVSYRRTSLPPDQGSHPPPDPHTTLTTPLHTLPGSTRLLPIRSHIRSTNYLGSHTLGRRRTHGYNRYRKQVTWSLFVIYLSVYLSTCYCKICLPQT